MAKKDSAGGQQIGLRNISSELVRVPEDVSGSLRWWAEQYFKFEVTTSEASQKVQRRDLELFIQYIAVADWRRVEDRNRNRGEGERPKRKGYRAYRNRAVVYTLIETGMRRAAVRSLNLADVDWKRKSLSVVEKGGHTHRYQISGEGLQAIRD